MLDALSKNGVRRRIVAAAAVACVLLGSQAVAQPQPRLVVFEGFYRPT